MTEGTVILYSPKHANRNTNTPALISLTSKTDITTLFILWQQILSLSSVSVTTVRSGQMSTASSNWIITLDSRVSWQAFPLELFIHLMMSRPCQAKSKHLWFQHIFSYALWARNGPQHSDGMWGLITACLTLEKIIFVFITGNRMS